MTPDDENRLAEIRATLHRQPAGECSVSNEGVLFALRMVDEAVRARIAAEAALTRTENSLALESRQHALTAERAERAEAERDGVRANQKEQHEAYEAAKRLTRDDAKCGLLRMLEMRISGQRCTLRDLQGRYDALLRGDTSRVLESFRHEKRESRRAYAGWAAARERIKEIETALSDAQALLAQYGEAALVAERVLAEERAKREAAEQRETTTADVLNHSTARAVRETIRAEQAEARVAQLEKTLDTSKWEDAPLPEDAAIDAAHPLKTKRHDLFSEAMRLVGARRSKGGLVELVNWLLWERDRLRSHAKSSHDAAAQFQARVEELQAVVDGLRKLCRCGGTGSYTPTCYRCDDSTDDHECPDDRPCVVPACLLARELAAKETG